MVGQLISVTPLLAQLALVASYCRDLLLRGGCLLWLCLCGSPLPLLATEVLQLQPWLTLTQTMQEQDISSYGAISQISEDPQGRLWLATRSGLLQYDGSRLQRVTPATTLTQSNTIVALDSSNDDYLFMLGYDHQLHRLHVASQQLETISLAKVLQPASFNVARWYAEPDKLWLIGDSELRYIDKQSFQLVNTGIRLHGKISRYARQQGDPAQALLIFTDQGQLWRWQSGQPAELLVSLAQQKPAESLLPDHDRLYVLQNKQLWQIDTRHGTADLLLDVGVVYQAHPFQLVKYQQQLWLSGHQVGLIRYDLTAARHRQFTQRNSMLGDKETGSLFKDSLDNLWIGSVNHGLLRLSLRHLQINSWQKPASTDQTLRPLLALSLRHWLVVDQQQQLFVWDLQQQQLTALAGPLKGYQAVRYSPELIIILADGGYYSLRWPSLQSNWHPLAELQQLPFPRLLQATVAPDGQLFVTSFAGIAQIKQPGLPPARWIKPLRDEQQSISYSGIQLINHQLWISTRTEGLLQYDLRTDQTSQFQPSDYGVGNQLFGITAEAQQLWLATDAGATRLDVSKPAQPVRNAPVLGIAHEHSEVTSVSVRADQVMLHSPRQIWWVQQKNWQATQLSAAHGVTFPLLPAGLFTADGNYLFGTGKGLHQLDLHQPPPPVSQRFFLAELQTFRRTLSQHQLQVAPVELAADERNFRLLIGGFASTPVQMQFQIRHNPGDNQWSAPVNQPQFDLFNLPVGPSLLEVRWQTGLTTALRPLQLRFEIARPWYSSLTAYLMYALLLFGIASLIWQQQRQRRRLRARYLQQLEQQEQQLRLALWGSGDELWDWQLAPARLTRRRCQEDGTDQVWTQTMALTDFIADIHPDDQPQVKQLLQAIQTGQQQSFQMMYRRLDQNQQWVWLLDRGKITGRTADGAIGRISGTSQNIQPLKTIEEQLLLMNNSLEQLVLARTDELKQSNHQLKQTIRTLQNTRDELREVTSMAMLGRMVAGVSHELNSPLSVVIMSVSSIADISTEQQQQAQARQLTAERFQSYQQQITSSCALAQKNLNRISKLLSVFKKLAVNLSGETVSTVHLPTFWQTIWQSHQALLTENAALLQASHVDDVALFSYVDGLMEIMHQLILNSLQHAETTEPLRITVQLRIRAGHCIIRFADNGKPLARHQRQQIFEPFMTSRRNHGHAGLGLTLVYNLVTQLLHGQIRYHRKPACGWFTIRFASQLSTAEYSASLQRTRQLSGSDNKQT